VSVTARHAAACAYTSLLRSNRSMSDVEPGSKPVVTLFSAPGCHLCEQAHALLQSFERQGTLFIEDVNIRTSAELQREMGLRIPVVRFSHGLELSWPFTAEQVQSALSGP
jgi:Glutaredoxin-like domain (DUF836)